MAEIHCPVTSHVLDQSRGCPAAGISVVIEKQVSADGAPHVFEEMGRGVTNADGRIPKGGWNFSAGASFPAGTYRLTFDVATYQLSVSGKKGFYPYCQLVFDLDDPSQHYHVPLLLSPYGFSTYRGS